MQFETKVAREARNLSNRIKKIQTRETKRVKVKPTVVETKRPSMKFVFEKDDYLVWARQIAAAAKGELNPPTMSEWANWRRSLKNAAVHESPRWRFVDNRVIEETIDYNSSYIDDFGRTMPAVELIENESIQPLGTDVPDDLYLYEMGCNVRRTESLDYRALDDRMFREKCVVANGRLYALYEKRRPDLMPRSDFRQEVLDKMMEETKADWSDIDTLAHVFRDMRLSRRAVLALVHGYVRESDGQIEKSSGLKSLDADELAEMALEFEQMNEDLKEFDIPEPETNRPRTIEDERSYWLKVSHDLWDRGQFGDGLSGVLSQIRFIEQSAQRDVHSGYYVDPDHVDSYTIYRDESSLHDYYDDPEDEDAIEWDPASERTALSIDSNTYSAHPLSDERSGLDDEFINEIKVSSWKELSETKRWLMSNDSWFLTGDQRSMAWGFVKGREDQLIADALKRPIAKLVASYITTTNDSKRACAMLFSWKQLDRFDTETANFKFDEEAPPLEEELAAAWTIFRREHRDHQRARRIAQNRGKYAMFAYRDRKVELKTDADGKTYAVVEKTKAKRIAVMRNANV